MGKNDYLFLRKSEGEGSKLLLLGSRKPLITTSRYVIHVPTLIVVLNRTVTGSKWILSGSDADH